MAVICYHCEGKGYFQDTDLKCPFCHGSGKIEVSNFEFLQHGSFDDVGSLMCCAFFNGDCGSCKFMKLVDGSHRCGFREWLQQRYSEPYGTL